MPRFRLAIEIVLVLGWLCFVSVHVVLVALAIRWQAEPFASPPEFLQRRTWLIGDRLLLDRWY